MGVEPLVGGFEVAFGSDDVVEFGVGATLLGVAVRRYA